MRLECIVNHASNDSRSNFELSFGHVYACIRILYAWDRKNIETGFSPWSHAESDDQ